MRCHFINEGSLTERIVKLIWYKLICTGNSFIIQYELNFQLTLENDLMNCDMNETTKRTMNETQNISVEYLEERKNLDFTDKLWKVSFYKPSDGWLCKFLEAVMADCVSF